MGSRALVAWLVLGSLALPCAAGDDVAATVGEGLRRAEALGGRSFHRTDPVAAMGAPAVPALAAVLRDRAAPEERRVLAAEALGRIRAPEAGRALRAALDDALRLPPSLRFLPDAVRSAVEESLFFHGDTEPIDVRIARIATKHRDLPIAASGARLRLARTYLATGRFRVAAGLLEDLVRSEVGARPAAARRHAYDWACAASLAGDREKALEAGRLALRADGVDLDWMATDLDLAFLREDPTFRLLLGIARVGRGFRGLLRDDAGSAPGAEAGPEAAEYEALDAGYREASDAWLEAYERYWKDYRPWLERTGRTRSPDAAAEYVREHGPEPAGPEAEWKPRFRAFFEKHRGTPLGRSARGRLLSMADDEGEKAEFLPLFLDALASDPDLGAVADHVQTALVFAWSDPERRAEVRAALTKAVDARADDPRVAEVRLALAGALRWGDDDAAARAAYAEIVKRHPGTDAASEAGTALYEMERLADGLPAPDFRAVGIDGRAWSLADLRGKVVLLDFWATWCGPCLGEIPTIKAVAKEHAGDDLVLLGVSLDDDGWDLAELLEAEGIGWPQVCDLEGFDGPLCRLYAVTGIPRTVLIDREGRIAATDLDGEHLAEAVRRLLAPAK